jgi:hypothetical protein
LSGFLQSFFGLGTANSALLISLLLLATAFGALVALIGVEIRKKFKTRHGHRSSAGLSRVSNNEETTRRQEIVVQLMSRYSGVHSVEALSDFINKELEWRRETWRVHIPPNGPGRIVNLEST